MSDTVVMGQQGRVVIPAKLRRQLDLHPGDHLSVTIAGRSLLLGRAEDAAQRLLGMFADVSPGVSWVDELIAERREAATHE